MDLSNAFIRGVIAFVLGLAIMWGVLGTSYVLDQF